MNGAAAEGQLRLRYAKVIYPLVDKGRIGFIKTQFFAHILHTTI